MGHDIKTSLPSTAFRTSAAALLLLLSSLVLDGASYGLRHVKDFSKEVIGNAQVWDISAGADDGHIYFATNSGLFDYNGVSWENYRPEGSEILRALRYDYSESRLYSCGVNEFGYWTRNSYGRLDYRCLYRNMDFRSRSHEFWRIAASGRKVFFQCKEKIYSYDPDTDMIVEICPEQYFRYMYEVNGNMYFQDGRTLYLFENSLEKRKICDSDSRIINLTAGPHGELLAAVEHTGIMSISENGELHSLNDSTNTILSEAKITCCRRYSPELLLAGTTRGGLFILDNSGKVSHDIPFGNRTGNSTVLSAAADKQGNIWLGLDAGVISIDNSTKDYYLSDSRLGQVHDFLSFSGGRLLIGSNKGLFVLDGEQLDMIPRSTGPVWKLAETGGMTYVLHDLGIFRLTQNLEMVPVMTGKGAYTICRCRKDPDSYIVGTYSGISLMRMENGTLRYVSQISGYNGFTREICIDEKDRIWVTVPNVGYVRLTLSSDRQEVTEIRNFDIAGKGQNIFPAVIDTELLLCRGAEAYSIDYMTDSLVHSDNAERILGLCGKEVKSIMQRENIFWYISDDGIGCIERIGATLTKKSGILEQAVSEHVSTGFRNIEGAEAIGFRNGLGFSYGSNSLAHPIEIGMVTAHGLNGTIYHDLEEPVFRIPYNMNSLCIWPMFLQEGHMLEYRVKSLSSEWQTVKADKFLQIPALPHGRHLIELKESGTDSTEAIRQIHVQVRPPWFISWQMIVLYLLCFAAIIAAVRQHYIKKAEELQREQKRKEKERISELERENLRLEVRSKDKRLANITMGNIKRNNMLNDIKEKVQELAKQDDPGSVQHSVSQILRQIDTFLKDDSDWQKSESYFNNIYDGLLDRLKASYPSLSKTDLKLCVYIKLNLSTKEIADLMNISPRSVEMARYRLRKKLGLPPEASISSVLK